MQLVRAVLHNNRRRHISILALADHRRHEVRNNQRRTRTERVIRNVLRHRLTQRHLTYLFNKRLVVQRRRNNNRVINGTVISNVRTLVRQFTTQGQRKASAFKNFRIPERNRPTMRNQDRIIQVTFSNHDGLGRNVAIRFIILHRNNHNYSTHRGNLYKETRTSYLEGIIIDLGGRTRATRAGNLTYTTRHKGRRINFIAQRDVNTFTFSRRLDHDIRQVNTRHRFGFIIMIRDGSSHVGTEAGVNTNDQGARARFADG